MNKTTVDKIKGIQETIVGCHNSTVVYSIQSQMDDLLQVLLEEHLNICPHCHKETAIPKYTKQETPDPLDTYVDGVCDGMDTKYKAMWNELKEWLSYINAKKIQINSVVNRMNELETPDTVTSEVGTARQCVVCDEWFYGTKDEIRCYDCVSATTKEGFNRDEYYSEIYTPDTDNEALEKAITHFNKCQTKGSASLGDLVLVHNKHMIFIKQEQERVEQEIKNCHDSIEGLMVINTASSNRADKAEQVITDLVEWIKYWQGIKDYFTDYELIDKISELRGTE